MKRFFFSLVASLILFAAPASAQNATQAPDAIRGLSDRGLVHRVKGGIVRIEVNGTFRETLADGKEVVRRSGSTGTGFIVVGGYIVTNDHVVRTPDGRPWESVTITGEFSFELPGTESFTARKDARSPLPRPLAGPGNFESHNWTHRTCKLQIVGQDSRTDLAVLKLAPIEKNNIVSMTDAVVRSLRMESYALRFAHPGSYDIGEDVVAIGFAKAITGMPSVSKGIISGMNRSTGLHSDMVQTDAAINGGNSGGPLFNRRGLIVGVNTCGLASALTAPVVGKDSIGKLLDAEVTIQASAQNINYARSSRTAGWIVWQIIKEGRVARLGLGLTVMEVTRDESRNLRIAQGVVVSEVRNGSAAEQAGIKVGDILTHLNGETIECVGDYNFAISLPERGTLTAKCQRFPDSIVSNVVAYLTGRGNLPARDNLDPVDSLEEVSLEIAKK